MKIMGIFKYDDGGKSADGMLVWPDSSLVRNGKPIFLPSELEEYKVMISPAVKINRLGKSITKKFSNRYYDEITAVGLILPSRITEQLSKAGLPVCADFVIDYGVITGDFISKDAAFTAKSVSINQNNLNGTPVFTRSFNLNDVLTGIEEGIQYASKNNTLKNGDLIVLMDPSNTLEAVQDTKITALFDNKEILNFKLK